MTDEKKYTGWKRTYIGLLNAATVICIILGLVIHVGGWIGRDVYRNLTGFGRSVVNTSSDSVSEKAEAVGVFTKVEGEIDAGNVVISVGDGFGCSYENYPAGEEPQIKQSSDTLRINQKAKNNWKIGEFKGQYSGAKIVITIPKDTAVNVDLELKMGALEAEKITLGDLDLDADMGSIELKDMVVKDLDLNADMGAITVEDTTFEEGNFKAAMGGITLSGVSFDEANAKADMGGISVQGSFNKLEAHCSMGGIDVTAEGGDAKLDLSADMGGVTVNGESVGRNYNN